MSAKKNCFEKPELSVEELSHALYSANLKLNEANQQLLQQEKQRLEFYANISHDLRAPVTALSNSVEYMLSCPELSCEELNENLLIMQKRIAYMEHLINDIFLLSSLDSSDNKVHKENVDMRFLLEDYFYLCEEDSRYENAELKLTFDNATAGKPIYLGTVSEEAKTAIAADFTCVKEAAYEPVNPADPVPVTEGNTAIVYERTDKTALSGSNYRQLSVTTDYAKAPTFKAEGYFGLKIKNLLASETRVR